MAKNKVVKDLPVKYRGFFSTVVISLIMLFVVFFVPMISANLQQDARSGSGRFSPQELTIWDFESSSDYEYIKYTSDTTDEKGNDLGLDVINEDSIVNQNEAVFWRYHSEDDSSNDVNVINGIKDDINIIDLPNEDTWGKYGVYNFVPNAIDTTANPDWVYPHVDPVGASHQNVPESLSFTFDIDVETFIEEDATKILFFINYSEANVLDVNYFRLTYHNQDSSYIVVNLQEVQVGQVNEFTIDTQDLINIATLQGDKEYFKLSVFFGDGDSKYTDGSTLTFDMRVMGLKSRTASITIISVWNVLLSVVITLMAIVAHPAVSIGDLLDMVTSFTKTG